MAPIADDLLIRMLVRESLLRENVFDSVVQQLKQKFGNKYDAALNSQSLRQLIDPSKLASLRDEEIEYMLNPLSDSWFGRLGTTLGYDINFHKLLDGKNNYRAAISSEFVDLSVGFFKNLEKYYGIKRVVTLNSDGGGADIPAMVTAAGLESIYVPIEETSQPTRDQFEKIVNGLLSGNALIHCTNGADRTGAIVARYYVEELGMNPATALEDSNLYGFRAELVPLQDFIKGIDSKKETPPPLSQSQITAPFVLPKKDSVISTPIASPPPSSTDSYDKSERKQIARGIFKLSKSGGYHLISSEQCERIKSIPAKLQAFLDSRGRSEVVIKSNGVTRSLQKSLAGGGRRLRGTLHGSGLAHDLKISSPGIGIYDGEITNNKILKTEHELVLLLEAFGKQENLRWVGYWKIGKKEKIGSSTYYAAELHHYEIKQEDLVSCLSPGLKAYMDIIGMPHNEIGDTDSRIRLFEMLLSDITS
jgi:hypothetical protein